MKALTTIGVLIFLIIMSATQSVRAQDASNWTEQSPEGEEFKVIMPPIISVTPGSYQFGGMSVNGKLYTAKSGAGLYRIWSLEDGARANSTPAATDAYLDACADLVWESLLKADREKTEKTGKKFISMQYRRELLLGTIAAGREYSITMDITQGLVHFYNHQNRLYVLVATVPAFVSAQDEQFLKSFTLANQKLVTVDADPVLFPPNERPIPGGDPNSAGRAGAGIGTGTKSSNPTAAAAAGAAPASEDFNRLYSPREVTKKASILSKPEPMYTEPARNYGVSGTVVLRATLSKTGEVTDIQVNKKLPHGLTGRAIAAARGIRFHPAQMNGHTVSQYIIIIYNFNLY